MNATDLDSRTKRIAIIGALLGLLLAASNQTIVSTALPTIVADLGGLNLLAWVFTGYLLTSTTIVPITGKLGDIYGRKPLFMSGIVVFMLASIAGGFVQSMEHLIIVRAVQGLGGGMLISSVFAIIGDLFPPNERGRYQGLFTSMFAVASILGPTAGGAITDAFSWRGIFYFNLPLGLAALALIGGSFPRLQRPAANLSIDYTGVAVLTAMLVCLLLALAWAGDVYAWGSVEIVGLLVAAGGLFVIFLTVESFAREPIIPLPLFKNRVFAAACVLAFAASGISLMGVLTFMPMFLQGVLGASPTNSGLVLSPMMIAVVFASNAGGQLVTRTGRYRTFILLGAAILVAGMFVLSRFSAGTGWPEAIFGMTLVGFGIGLAMPIINLTVQNSVPRRHLGVATSSSQFFRQIGATLGVAVFGTLVVTGITSNLERTLPPQVTDAAPPALIERLSEPQVVLTPHGRGAIEQSFLQLGGDGSALYDAAMTAVEASLADAVADVFFAGFLVALFALALALLIPERPVHVEAHDRSGSIPGHAPAEGRRMPDSAAADEPRAVRRTPGPSE